MGEREIDPAKDQRLSPMAELKGCMQSVLGTSDIPGIPEGQRSELKIGLLRRTMLQARVVAQNPLIGEAPSLDEALGLLQQVDAFFVLRFENEIRETMDRIMLEEKEGPEEA